jgi:hypothetical protein
MAFNVSSTAGFVLYLATEKAGNGNTEDEEREAKMF